MNLLLKYKQLFVDSADLIEPQEGNAGFDIPCYGEYVIDPGQIVALGTGLAIEIPTGFVGWLMPRSGNAFKLHLLGANVGVIDSNFRGELKVLLMNASSTRLVVAHGQRVAQLVLVPYVVPTVRLVSSLSESNRGENGFGSSGLAASFAETFMKKKG